MALTGRAAMVALVSVLAVLAFRAPMVLVAINAALLAGIMLDVLLAAPVRRLRLTRAGDTRVRLGESVTITLTIGNPSSRPLRGWVRDAWPPSGGARPARAAVAASPEGLASLTIALAPTRRGDCTAHKTTIRSLGPLGLAGRQRSMAVPWTVRALPPFTSRRHLPGKLAMLRELDGQHRAIVRGQGTEFDSLREYVIGDDVRSIDWRSTARRGEVLVRTWRPERDRRVIFVLDTGRTSAGRVAGFPRLDASMDAIQLVAALAGRAGDRVDLIAADRRVRARVLAPPRTTALAALTDAMATLEPELIESDGRLIATTVLTHARRRCLVVLLTDLNPAAELLAEFKHVASRHELVVASVADPRIDDLAAGRGEADLVYAAAAATYSLGQRARARAELVRLGATVVDAPPTRLPPALADAYLSLKSAGRLG